MDKVCAERDRLKEIIGRLVAWIDVDIQLAQEANRLAAREVDPADPQVKKLVMRLQAHQGEMLNVRAEAILAIKGDA